MTRALQTASAAHAADPAFSANVYAAGALDALFPAVVAPLLATLRDDDPEARAWGVRYSRRGEHLKLRIHSALDRALLATRVREAADRFFAEASETPEERAVRFDVPAIDPEDEGAEEAPDRSVLETTYRRSSVTLGAEPVLEDDVLVGAMCRALAAGLDACAGAGEELPRRRQNVLLQLHIAGLAVLAPGDAAAAREYLDYHRDWLLRFFVADADRERELRAHFDERLAAMGPTLEALAGAASLDPADDESTWSGAVAEVVAAAEPRLDEEGFDLDPFASSQLQPVLFKVFHGAANCAGIRPLDEAFLCGLLARSLALASDEPVDADRAEVAS